MDITEFLMQNSIIVLAIWAIGFFVGLTSMWWDKRCAIKKKWRVPERDLLLIAIFGGGEGTFVGMYMFRHKTQNIKFAVGVPIIIFIRLCVLFGLVYMRK